MPSCRVSGKQIGKRWAHGEEWESYKGGVQVGNTCDKAPISLPLLDVLSFIFFLDLWHKLRIKGQRRLSIGLCSLETAIKKLPGISPALVFVMCAHMHVWAHMCASSRRNLELLRWPGTCGSDRPWGGEVAEVVSGNYIKWGNSVRRICLDALISNVSCKLRLGQSLTDLHKERSSHQMQIYKGKRRLIPVFSTKTSRPLEF